MLFSSKKYYTTGESLSRKSWHRFKTNPTGITALGVISVAVIVAILGYLITPDNTPFANTQILEISTLQPGSKIEFLKVRKNKEISVSNLFTTMLFGQSSKYTLIPITDIGFNKDEAVVRVFNQDNEVFVEEFNTANIVYALADEPVFAHDSIFFNDVNGNPEKVSVDVLQQEVASKNIITKTFWLGTDQYGRDMLSRLIIGSRVSLSVGAISVFISLIVGILLGAIAGFYRGRTDDVIMWFINVVWSIPTLLLVIAITFALGRGFWQIFVAVGLTMWVEVARVVRGQIISVREKEYIEAGFALGYSNFRIIIRHILPNILSPVIVISAANFASAILIEAGLSFLGIGVQPPMPSWGSMIKEYYSFIILDSAYLAVIPGVAIVILVLAFMALGNSLRDVLDVR